MTTAVRDKHGRFLPGQSGNPGGQPKDADITAFQRALRRVEGKQRKKLFEHAIERAFVNDRVLVMVLKKLLPDVKHIDADVRGLMALQGGIQISWQEAQPRPIPLQQVG